MCAGIRDAWTLSWKLDAVLRGRAGDELLDSYTSEPLPPLPHLSAGLLARAADGALAPMAGLPSPHGTVRWRAHEGRWDDVVGLGFCVVVRDADPAELLRPDQLRALAGLGAHAVSLTSGRGGDRVVDVEGKYSAFLKAHGAVGMITRPDFYVFGGIRELSGAAEMVDALIAALATNGVQVPPVAMPERSRAQFASPASVS